MDWNSSALWGIIGLIGGIIVSFVFYKISNKNKKIIYTKNSQILITNAISEIDGLNIFYKNQPINDLTSTTIIIKSVGKDIINVDDFGKATPLCIKTTGNFFLQNNIESIITENSNPNNLIKPIIKDDKTILLDFDYLSQGDKITIILLHTNTLDIDGKLKMGTILSKNQYKKINFNLINMIFSAVLMYFPFFALSKISNSEIAIINLCTFSFYFGLGIFLLSYAKNILSNIIINVKEC